MISLEEFCKIIQTIKSHFEKTSEFSQDMSKYFDGFPMFKLDGEIVEIVFLLLENIFKDKSQWIAYFCYDLDFGAKYQLDSVLDANHIPIDLSTPDKLYYFLLKEGKL